MVDISCGQNLAEICRTKAIVCMSSRVWDNSGLTLERNRFLSWRWRHCCLLSLFLFKLGNFDFRFIASSRHTSSDRGVVYSHGEHLQPLGSRFPASSFRHQYVSSPVVLVPYPPSYPVGTDVVVHCFSYHCLEVKGIQTSLPVNVHFFFDRGSL